VSQVSANLRRGRLLLSQFQAQNASSVANLCIRDLTGLWIRVRIAVWYGHPVRLDTAFAMENVVNSIRRRRVLRALAVLGLSAAVTYWVIKDAPLPFRATWWQAGERNWADPLHRRHRIADWLVISNRLNGRTRTDVVSLLGEPPPTEYFKDWDMVYMLGAERGFISIDSEWLVLRMDSRGIVHDAQIVRD